MVDAERNRAEELKNTLEALKSEANEARIKFDTERSKNEEAQKKLEAEKNKANKEKKRADSEMAKAELQKRCAEEEKKRADSEMAKAELQKRCAEEERKKLLNEQNRSDELSRRLEEEKKRSEELERKVQDMMNTEKLEKACPDESDRQHETEQLVKEGPANKQLQKKESVSAREVENVNTEAANLMFLEKQLELEKKHVKHAKKVAKFEKKRNNLLQQEIYRLKQDLFQFCRQLNLLDGFCSHGVEGIDASAKISNRLCVLDTNLKGKLSGKEPCEMFCESENEVVKAHHTTKDCYDHVGAALALYGGSCAKPLSGKR
ncbi:hypothetical protein MKW94_026308 [Papaver nudicaule]|uniref:Uncharacterized protein n=1 Tax=Papaver nudicaule TaxID=74823 RepID=A0AA41SE79_PAPNU|nr:hypothetical protein [Papaver nudicaule]